MAKAEGERKDIAINGIVRNTTKLSGTDGDCEELVNLRYEDGTLKPVFDKQEIKVYTHAGVETSTSLGYDKIYFHTCNYTHLLGLRKGKLYYFADQPDEIKIGGATKSNKNGDIQLLEDEILVMDINAPILHYSQIGNYINIIDNSGLRCAFFIAGNYKEQLTSFSSRYDSSSSQPDVPIQIYRKDKVSGLMRQVYSEYIGRNEGNNVSSKHFINNYLAIKSEEVDMGNIHGVCLACVTFEMKDGTNILMSSPVLIDAPNPYATRSRGDVQGGHSELFDKYPYNKIYRITEESCFECNYGSAEIESGCHYPIEKMPDGTSAYKSWKVTNYRMDGDERVVHYRTTVEEENRSFDIDSDSRCIDFSCHIMSKVRGDHQVNGIKIVEGAVDGHYYKAAYVYAQESKLCIKCPESITENLDTIENVNVWITNPVSYIDEKTLEETRPEERNYNFFHYPYYSDEELLNRVKNSSSLFYKVYSIKIKDLNNQIGEEIEIPLEKEVLGVTNEYALNTLTQHDALLVGSYDRSSIIPKVGYAYNSKLHIANYSEGFFYGHPYDKLKSYYSKYIRKWMFYWFFDADSYIDIDARDAKLNEKYNWNVKITTVIEKDGEQFATVKYNKVDNKRPLDVLALSPVISYPDSRAVTMKFEIWTDLHQQREEGAVVQQRDFDDYVFAKEFTLTPNYDLNYAYYASDRLYPIFLDKHDYSDYGKIVIDGSDISKPFDVPNGIKVSNTNNPLYFPAEQTYQVGNAPIMALCANTIGLSTGQFGDTPLYVFSEDGIFGLFVDTTGEIAYKSSRPVSRDVCDNADTVMPIDDAVIFSTSRGLMAISGSKVEELSELIEGDYFDFANAASIDYTAQSKEALQHRLLAGDTRLDIIPTKEKFKAYLKGAMVGYNYNDREVWVCRHDSNYSYVLKEGVWYKRTCDDDTRIKQIVQNYPFTYLYTDSVQHYMVNTSKLFDIGMETDGEKSKVCFYLTRPISLGSASFKEGYRIIQRSYLKVKEGKYAGFYVFGSYDSRKWSFIGGMEHGGDITDIGAKIERIDCKYFRICFVADLTEGSVIDYITTRSRRKMDNKLR